MKIDFASNSVADSTYTVTFGDNKLTLTAGKGTAAPDSKYILNKVP